MRAIMVLKNAGMIDSGIFNDVEELKKQSGFNGGNICKELDARSRNF